MQLGNAAFSYQLAASERSFGNPLGSLELSVAALGSLAVYLPNSLGMKLAACKADFAALQLWRLRAFSLPAWAGILQL